MTQKACFIGLGSMGTPMASNLLKNQLELYVYNRSKEKEETLIKSGAKKLVSLQEAFEKADIVFSMLADDHALNEICLGNEGILKRAKPGKIHVSMSTVSPMIVKKLASLHEEKGVKFISAPVFGRPEAAAAQKIWICMAGEKSAKEKVKPLLQMVGQRVEDFGEEPELANCVKLAGNFIILSIVESLSESFAFAEKSGVDTQQMYQFLIETLFPSPVIQTYGKLIVSRQFKPAGFKMHLGLKDMDLLLRTADHLQVPMPVAGILHDRLLAGLANHRGDMDWSAIALTTYEEAGLK